MKPFRDEYTDFTFNGTTSRQMKVWITNSNDIQFRLTPEFSDTFVSPAFSNSSILTGTNVTKSTFKLKCIAVDITMSEWRAIQRWLSPDVAGRLEFDFNLNTYYNAKITKSVSGTTFIRGSYDKVIGDIFVVTFDLEFTTIDDYAALGPVNVGQFPMNSTYSVTVGCPEGSTVTVRSQYNSTVIPTVTEGTAVVSNLHYDEKYYMEVSELRWNFKNEGDTFLLDATPGAITHVLRDNSSSYDTFTTTPLSQAFWNCIHTSPFCTDLSWGEQYINNSWITSSNQFFFKCSQEFLDLVRQTTTETEVGLNMTVQYNSGEVTHYQSINNVATSNNNYFLPMFVKDSPNTSNLGGKDIVVKSTTSSGFSAGDGSIIGYFLQPGYIDYDHSVPGVNYMSKYTIYACATGTSNYYEIRGSKNGGQNTNKVYYTIPASTTGQTIKLFSDVLYYQPASNSNLSISVTGNNSSYRICNTGSYSMYPDITIKPNDGSNVFTVYYNKKPFYSYKYKVITDQSVNINGRQGLVLSGNSLADESYVYSYNVNSQVSKKQRVFDTVDKTNLGILEIPTGNAELTQCKILKNENLSFTTVLIGGFTEADPSDYSLITLRTSTPLQFSHGKAIIHLFADVRYSQAFNYDFYPTNESIDKPERYVHSFTDSNILKESSIFEGKEHNTYHIIGPKYELEKIKENVTYYLSLCDSTDIQFDGQGFIFLQTRGAF